MNPQQPPVPPTQPPQNPPKPVAYDQYGQPLYAHPPTQPPEQPVAPLPPPPQPEVVASKEEVQRKTAETGQPPQVVYMTRSVDPHQQEISPDIKAKHDTSARRYPQLNLSDGEYVLSAVRRHPIGLVSIWGVVVIAVLVVFIGFPVLLSSSTFFGGRNLPAGAIMSGGIMLLLAAVLFILGGIIATVVYQANRFYLTNESVIQHIQTSLFTKKDQTISLANIEDASYRQQGIIQTLFNYGSIRLSTEGEETTYRFNFVANPKKEIDRLNNAVEAFKNFRPIDTNED
jgi:hypothetical protein